MIKFKTRSDKRDKYEYDVKAGIVDENGENLDFKHEIEVSEEDGVTEEWIKELHRLDDNEVVNNWNNWRPKLTKNEEEYKKEWKKEHPGEEYVRPYNISFDDFTAKFVDGDISKNRLLASASYDPFKEKDSDDVIRLREIIDTKLTDRQRTALVLILLNGYTGVDAARIMGISPSMAVRHLKKAIERIKKYF